MIMPFSTKLRESQIWNIIIFMSLIIIALPCLYNLKRKNMIQKKTIKEVSILWKEDKKQYVKLSTFSAYTLILENHIYPTFGEMYELEESKVQNFTLQKLNAGLSHKSIKDILIVLKMILKFGVKHGFLEYKEWDIKFPTERETQHLDVLSIADQKRIMKFIQEHFTFKNLGIYICLSTGLRIGEVCALTWNDINIETGIISIRKTIERIYIIEDDNKHTELIINTPKTKNSIREIPMTKELIKTIKPLKKIVNDNYYILTNEEKPTEPRTYRNYYIKLMKELNIPKLKFHGLRHSFATRCIESNCDYKTVSVILGQIGRAHV